MQFSVSMFDECYFKVVSKRFLLKKHTILFLYFSPKHIISKMAEDKPLVNETVRLRNKVGKDPRKIAKEVAQNYYDELAKQWHANPVMGAMAKLIEDEKIEVPWTESLGTLGKYPLRFGVNAICDTNPTNLNLSRWFANRKISEKCSLCGTENESLTHVLASCKVALGTGAHDPKNRMLYRHDSILKVIADDIKQHVPDAFSLIIDLKSDGENYAALPVEGPVLPHVAMLGTLRPDIVLESNEKIIIGELTSPMEHNIRKQHEYKANKYKNFQLPEGDHRDVVVMPFEVGARGGISNSLNKFLTMIGFSKKQYKETRIKASKSALNASTQIFANKNTTDWIPPSI